MATDKLKPYSDEELIAQFIESGDNRMFAALSARYEQLIFKKCLSYTQDRDQASDLSQEIQIKLFLQLPQFRNQSRFSTWLYTIVHSTCIDFLRKRKKQLHEAISDKIKDELPDMIEEAEEVPEALSEKIMDELLEQLNKEEKVLLLLKYKEKQSIKDIMNAMHLSESAVKMRLKRARERAGKLYRAYK
ncbi:MAG TPA: hypothetical protein DDY13_19130 [Cytophagales bacterium]|jgi:RNA polymerase sigma factor (sigma-70 family)|nr:hypothetical protein [Cytophagales bacterium]